MINRTSFNPKRDTEGEIVRTFHKNGRVKTEISYRNNTKDGIEFENWDNGIRKKEIPWDNGLIVGVVRWYFSDGSLNQKTLYNGAGNKYGLETLFHENGRIRVKNLYRNGELHGTSEWYNDRGTLARIIPWEHGKKEGVEIEYFTDGTIKRKTLHTNKGNKMKKEYEKYCVIYANISKIDDKYVVIEGDGNKLKSILIEKSNIKKIYKYDILRTTLFSGDLEEDVELAADKLYANGNLFAYDAETKKFRNKDIVSPKFLSIFGLYEAPKYEELTGNASNICWAVMRNLNIDREKDGMPSINFLQIPKKTRKLSAALESKDKNRIAITSLNLYNDVCNNYLLKDNELLKTVLIELHNKHKIK